MIHPTESVPIVIVLGMHRSGTSLCANMLHAMGVDMAEEPGASPNNRRGHWERPWINDFNDQVFALFGRGWKDASHVLALPPRWLDDPRVQAIGAALADRLGPRIAAAKAWGFAAWGFKDPRTARLLPLWRQVLEQAGAAPRFVYCVRDPAQVSRSLGERDKLENAQAEYRWLVYNADAVAGVGADPVCIVPYEDWFSEPTYTAHRLASWVGGRSLRQPDVEAIVDPSLRHDAELAPSRPLAGRLHRLIQRGATANELDGDVRGFCALLGEFEQQVTPLLVDVEVLRSSVTSQNRVIRDLNAAIQALRVAKLAVA